VNGKVPTTVSFGSTPYFKQPKPRLITDDLTPAEMRALIRASGYILQNIDIFKQIHPNLVDRKVAVSAVSKLSAALKTCSGSTKRKGVAPLAARKR